MPSNTMSTERVSIPLMNDQVARLEVSLEALQGDLSSIDRSIHKVQDELAHSLEDSGWRPLRNEIDELKWRAVTVPMIIAAVLNAVVSLAFLAALAYGIFRLIARDI